MQGGCAVLSEKLCYGTCHSLEDARSTAYEAKRGGLRGQFPAACVVLDMHVARLEHAIRGMLASCDDDSDPSPHVRIAELREVLRSTR